MNIHQWIDKFHGIMVDPRASSTALAELKAVFEHRTAVLYGAGLLGGRVRFLFQELGIPYLLVDKEAARIRAEKGLDVKEPSFLQGLSNADDYVLFATVNRLRVPSIREDLAKLSTPFSEVESGYDFHVTLQSAFCTAKHYRQENLALQYCYECSIMDNTCPVLARYLRDKNGFDPATAHGTPNLKMIGYVLGTVCSLNCRLCCESIPSVPRSNRAFVPTASVIQDISKLSNACEFLTLLEFVGGEPFLHPGLVSILETSLKSRNIGVIHIFTNGTVPPKDELCRTLAHPRIVIYISNYSKLLSERHSQQVAKTEQLLRSAGVSFNYGSNDNWYDMSCFDFVGDDEATLRSRFSQCFVHTCNRLHRGSLYRCPHHYGGVTTGQLQPTEEIVRIHEYSDADLPRRLDEFLARGFSDACRNCPMPFNAPFMPPGTQV
ncbi:MAG TPA: radical SAM protein [Myxococcales bacterium]|jgi:hypothetical protein